MRDVSRERLHASRRGDSGFSLIEVLLALGLATLVVMGLAAGFLTTISASDAASSRQRREAALTSFSESLKALPYVECTAAGADADGYMAAYEAGLGSGSSWQPSADADVSDLDVVDVTYWTPAGSGPSAGTFSDACGPTDHGAQRLTVSLKVQGEPVQGQVVLRRPS